MKAVVVRKLIDSPRELTVETLEDPKCPENGFLVEVRAIGVNFFDVLQIAGKYQFRPELPWTPGVEYSGIIKEIGPKASNNPNIKCHGKIHVGMRIFGSGDPMSKIPGGAAASILAVSPRTPVEFYPIPAQLTLKECCAIRATYLTAWHALVDRGRIREGEWVLINAAAGGVGSAAIHVAKYFNCTVVATCGSAAKAKVCKELGADYVVDYNADPNWGTTIKEITQKAGKKWAGVDIFYDVVGQLEAGLKCCAPHCRVLLIGFTSRTPEQPERVRTNILLVKQINIVPVASQITMTQFPELLPEVWNGIFRLFASSQRPKPVVYSEKRYLGIEKLTEAMEDLASRKSYGKVVVEIGLGDDGKVGPDPEGKAKL